MKNTIFLRKGLRFDNNYVVKCEGLHLSVKEIADKLSVSEQTVKNQLTDILKRLRKEISRENFCL